MSDDEPTVDPDLPSDVDQPGADVPTPSMRWGVVAAVAVTVVVLDQLTKWWAVENLQTRTVHLFWTLQLNLTHNTGLAFSLGGTKGPIIGLIALGIIGAVLWVGRGVPSTLGAVAVGLVVGGAFGNLIDRAFRAGGHGFLSGAVVDFIDPQWYPVFNVADMGVVIGTLLLMLALLLPSRSRA